MSIFTTFAKQSMINRLSNPINRNRSAAKISKVMSSISDGQVSLRRVWWKISNRTSLRSHHLLPMQSIFQVLVFKYLSTLSPSFNNKSLTAYSFLSTNFQSIGPQSIFKLYHSETTCQSYKAFFGPVPHPRYYFTSLNSLSYVLVAKFFDNSQVGHVPRRDPSTKSAPS